MNSKRNNSQHNTLHREQDKFTDEKKRKYTEITNKITSQIQTALILHKLKTWNNWDPDVAELSFDQNWRITESKGKNAPKKWPVDIQWHIEDVNILNIKKNLYQMIDKSEYIEKDDKTYLKDGINDFIRRHFPRTSLESKERLPHKAFRIHYKKIAKEQVDLDTEWQRLYKDICLTFANLLFEKDNEHLKDWQKKHQEEEKPPVHYNFVNKEWEITQKWLQYIWNVFLTAIKNIPNSWDPKGFHKIFHDWDFNFLRKEDSAGNPVIGTLNHYVRAIMYLMTDWFNAYAEWWENWNRERYIAKKWFLNQLYNASQLKNDYNIHQETSDKWIIHSKLSEAWMGDEDESTKNKNREYSTRLKTKSSKLLKIWWRTNDINDESWVRATYYWDIQDTEWIKEFILYKNKNYFNKICNINWIYIQSITSARKWDFISPEDEDTILKELVDDIWLTYEGNDPQISKRQNLWQKQSKLEYMCSKYKALEHKKPSPGLQQAYNIASGKITRWANGNYTDFKLCVEYFYKANEFNKWIELSENCVEKDGTMKEEISYYDVDNDLNMWNHGILDLEKRIFNQVKNVNVPDLWKSISLHRLRYYTETAIKDISFEIDKRNDKIKMWLLPPPRNDDYKYLHIGDKKVSLEWLIYRNQNNTDRFDTLILMILNYFMTHNKIFYIIPPNKWLWYSDEELKKLKHNFTSDWNFDTANEIEIELERREKLRNKWQIDKDDTGVSEQQLWLITKQQLHDKRAFKSRRFTTSDQLRNSALNPDNTTHCIGFYTTRKTKLYNNFYVVNLWNLWRFLSLENDH